MRELISGVVMTAAAGAAAGDLAVIEAQVSVGYSIDRAWETWTTAEGLAMFFAKQCVVEPKPGGAFEILFFPDNAPGLRGAEGTFLLAVEPRSRIAFSWNAPPQWPEERKQLSMVDVRFEPVAADRTRVRLRHFGFGDGEGWQGVREYFEGAWNIVLERLEHSSRVGPIDWDDVPPGLLFNGPQRQPEGGS